MGKAENQNNKINPICIIEITGKYPLLRIPVRIYDNGNAVNPKVEAELTSAIILVKVLVGLLTR